MPRKKAKLTADDTTGSSQNNAAEIRVHDNRLANFTNPVARSLKDHQKAKMSKLKSKSSRAQLSLVRLMDFPMDLFLEIATHLEPFDILHFSRVSKHFRSLLNPKNSRHVWIVARRNIPGLPDCPPDLTEAQYASLMFEGICQACGVNTVKVDYCLRLRFCARCFQMNVSKGGTIVKISQLGKIPPIVYKLLPRTMNPLFSDDALYTSSSNRANHIYYAPELHLVVKRYRSLEHDKVALDDFIQQQQTLATQLMQSGKALYDWSTSCKQTKQGEKADLAASRKKSIEAKLTELGWGEESFPQYWESNEWRKILDQPRELTPRIWTQVFPKLIQILEALRDKRLEAARRRRIELRAKEFSILWDEHLLSYPPEVRNFFPNRYDAVLLTSVAAALEEDDGNITVTSERFNTILPAALDDSAQYKTMVQSDLLKALGGSDQTLESSIASSKNGSPARFYRVSAIFCCWACSSSKLLAFPDLLSHSHVRDLRWMGNIRAAGLGVQTLVSELLRIFGLPVGILRDSEAFRQFEGRFRCNCGSITAESPLDFMGLVNHIHDSNQWHKVMTTKAINRGRYLEAMKLTPQAFNVTDHLHDDHALEYIPSLLSLAPPNALECSQRTSQEAHSDSVGFCDICSDLTGVTSRLTQEQVAYHMNSKHHINNDVFDMVYLNAQPES